MLLKSGKTPPMVALIGDLCRMPLHVKRQERLLSYWLKILKQDNLVFAVYMQLINDANRGMVNWVSKIRDMLFSLGLNNYWFSQDIDNISPSLIKNRIRDQYLQKWRSTVNDTSKLYLYTNFKENLAMEKYIFLDKNLIKIVSQFRCSSLKLEVETGRYKAKQKKRCDSDCTTISS
jgi:hypothetical protein